MRIVPAGDDRIGADDLADDFAAGSRRRCCLRRASDAALPGDRRQPGLFKTRRQASRKDASSVGRVLGAGDSLVEDSRAEVLATGVGGRVLGSARGILCGPRGVSAGWTWVGVTAGFSSAGRARSRRSLRSSKRTPAERRGFFLLKRFDDLLLDHLSAAAVDRMGDIRVELGPPLLVADCLGLLQSRAALIAERRSQMVLAAAFGTMRRQLAAWHGDEGSPDPSMIFKSRTTKQSSKVIEQNAFNRSPGSSINLMRTSVICTA